MKIKNSFLILVAFLLSACSIPQKEEIKIYFNKDKKIEVNSKINPCKLIEKINNQDIHPEEDKLSIKYKKWIIDCPSEIDTSKLGKQTLVYKVGKKQFKNEVEIVDTEKPKIIMKDIYEVEEKNEYFNILKEGEIVDNFSKNLTVGLNGNYDINKVGEYEVEVVANDESNNKEVKKIKIIVKQKEEKIKEVERVVTVTNNVESSITTPTQNTPSQQQTPNKNNLVSKKIGTNKKFLFKDGYTFKNVFDACSNYLNSVGSGTCLPLKNGGTYLGYEYQP